jgi:DNA-binding NarL/FixJ family response regulator
MIVFFLLGIKGFLLNHVAFDRLESLVRSIFAGVGKICNSLVRKHAKEDSCLFFLGK